MFAAKLGKKLAYTFYPQATGFVRMTLGSHRCDVIMGYPQGDDMVQNTNPYYQTAYALVTKRGDPLNDVKTLADPRLRGKRLGVVAGTPPATYLVADGLMTNAKPYPLVVDTRFDFVGRCDDQRSCVGRHRRGRVVGADRRLPGFAGQCPDACAIAY